MGQTCTWFLVQLEYGRTLGLGGSALLEWLRRARRRRSRSSRSIFGVIIKLDLITNSECRNAYTEEGRSWDGKHFVAVRTLSRIRESVEMARPRRSFTVTVLFSVRLLRLANT